MEIHLRNKLFHSEWGHVTAVYDDGVFLSSLEQPQIRADRWKKKKKSQNITTTRFVWICFITVMFFCLLPLAPSTDQTSAVYLLQKLLETRDSLYMKMEKNRRHGRWMEFSLDVGKLILNTFNQKLRVVSESTFRTEIPTSGAFLITSSATNFQLPNHDGAHHKARLLWSAYGAWKSGLMMIHVFQSTVHKRCKCNRAQTRTGASGRSPPPSVEPTSCSELRRGGRKSAWDTSSTIRWIDFMLPSCIEPTGNVYIRFFSTSCDSKAVDERKHEHRWG